MTTGSLCLTEILMSRKSCSSKRDASHSADSTSASGVALPYFWSSRASSEPALTPIRIGVPVVLGGPRDLLDLVVELLDVARVHADRGAAGVDRGEDVLRLEVDVRDDRDLRLAWRSSRARRRRPAWGRRRARSGSRTRSARRSAGAWRRCRTYASSSSTAPRRVRLRPPPRFRPGSAGSCGARRAWSERTACREKSQSSAVQPQGVDREVPESWRAPGFEITAPAQAPSTSRCAGPPNGRAAGHKVMPGRRELRDD